MSSDYAVGLLCILLGALFWSATAIIVQFLQIRYGFNSPFIITYVGCSLFILLIPSSILSELKVIKENEEPKPSQPQKDIVYYSCTKIDLM